MSTQFVILVMITQTAILIVMGAMLIVSRKRMSVAPFWEILQTQMADALHHPHPESRELDHLLEKLENKPTDILPRERDRLETLLREKAADPNESKEERNSAEFLLIAMVNVVREARK
jgi:hypothetical protein